MAMKDHVSNKTRQHSISNSRPKTLCFVASSSDYFQLWLRNILLTIVTFGVYGPWAKAQRLRFFFQGTQFKESSFDYHGRGIDIFKGRLILGGLLIVANLLSVIVEEKYVSLAFLGALPWLMHHGYRFRAHNISFRGIRFGFNGSAGDTYMAIVLPALFATVFFVIGGMILDPFVSGRVEVIAIVILLAASVSFFRGALLRLTWGNISYGSAPFSCTLKSSELLPVWALVMLGVAGFSTFARMTPFATGTYMDAAVILVILFVLYLAARSAIEGYSRGCLLDALSLDSLKFRSDLSIARLFGIRLKNAVLIAMTLGIYWPFAQIAIWKYRVESIVLIGEELPVVQRAKEVHAGRSYEDLTGDLGGLEFGF